MKYFKVDAGARVCGRDHREVRAQCGGVMEIFCTELQEEIVRSDHRPDQGGGGAVRDHLLPAGGAPGRHTGAAQALRPGEHRQCREVSH